jgi:hypothetical protein
LQSGKVYSARADLVACEHVFGVYGRQRKHKERRPE